MSPRSYEAARKELEREFGDLLEHRDEGPDPETYEEYADDPVRFIREVLGEEPWPKQEELAEEVRDEPQVAIQSCHGSGKDWLCGRLCLWWAVARKGRAVLTGSTAAQVEETLMRGEVRTGYLRGGLPGDLHVRAYRPWGGKAGIVAKTASETSGLTGLHDDEVFFAVSEAQAEGLEVAFKAAFANVVGEGDRILVYGQPLSPSGPFYRACRPESDWRTFKIAASDIPNVRQGETVIPGLITRQGVDRIASEYGEDSGYYKARVLAEFPLEEDEGVFRRSWLDAAAERHQDGSLAWQAREDGTRHILAADIARHGSDQTVVAVRRGPVLERFESWRGADTEATAKRIRALTAELGSMRYDPDTSQVKTVVCDAVGVGGGVADKLTSLPGRGWSVTEYKGSRGAKDDDRFSNRRAEAFWKLRKLLEAGEIALPDDEELFEELLAIRWRADGKGRVQLERKKDLKKRLGRSPDKADALAMAFARGVGGGLSAEAMQTRY